MEHRLDHAERGILGKPSGYGLEARAFALHGLNRRTEASRAFIDHVELQPSLENSLEYRTNLARQMLDELETTGEDLRPLEKAV